MSSRDRLLSRLDALALPNVALPEPFAGATEQPAASLRERFEQALVAAHGSACRADSAATLRAVVQSLRREHEARQIWSLVEGVEGTSPPGADPRAAAEVDLLVTSGAFGVAENGAVWIDERSLPSRAAPFLASHVVLLLREDRIVSNMHEAYDRLASLAAEGQAGRVAGGGVDHFPDYGCFVSGPSKTADIEQSLVVGAHGPRSLTLVFVDDSVQTS